MACPIRPLFGKISSILSLLQYMYFESVFSVLSLYNYAIFFFLKKSEPFPLILIFHSVFIYQIDLFPRV